MIHTDGTPTIAWACLHSTGTYTDLRGNTRCGACKAIIPKEDK